LYKTERISAVVEWFHTAEIFTKRGNILLSILSSVLLHYFLIICLHHTVFVMLTIPLGSLLTSLANVTSLDLQLTEVRVEASV